MNNNAKRWLVLVFAIVVLANLLVGCGISIFNKDATDSKKTEKDTEASDGKIAPEGTKFSMLYSDNASYPYREDWLILSEIKERTNVELELIPVPESDYNTKRQIIINSGDMPDIISKTLNNNIAEYALDGIFLPISDYEDQMPTYKRFITDFDYKQELNNMRQADGKYYIYPVKAEEIPINSHIWLARVDVFDELGVESPKTMDDLLEVGKIIKEKYPDTYPITNRFTAENITSMIGPAFGIEAGWGLGNGGFTYNEETDEWFFAPTSDQYKEMLMYMNEMLKAGVLDKEFITLDSNVYEQRVMTGSNFLLADWVGNEIRYNAVGQLENLDFNVQPIFPPQGPRGDYALRRTGKFTGGWAIPSSIVDKDYFDAFIKFLDWMYTEEAAMLTSFGIEGDTYYLDDNGIPRFNDAILAGDIDISKEYGINNNCLTVRRHRELNYAFMSGETKKIYADMEAVNAVKPPLPSIKLDANQREQEKLYVSTLKDYYKQMTEKFIFGKESFDNWDAFVAEAERKGVTQLRELYNSAWQATK